MYIYIYIYIYIHIYILLLFLIIIATSLITCLPPSLPGRFPTYDSGNFIRGPGQSMKFRL